MTSKEQRPRHPGQDDRRDTRKLRTKTDPDRHDGYRLRPAGQANPAWKPAPE